MYAQHFNMKNRNIILALAVVIASLGTITVSAQDASNAAFDRMDSVQTQNRAEQVKAQKSTDAQSMSDLKASRKETKARAKEARTAERDANAAAKESKSAYKTEKKAQKARRQADAQTKKAAKAREKANDN